MPIEVCDLWDLNNFWLFLEKMNILCEFRLSLFARLPGALFVVCLY